MKRADQGLEGGGGGGGTGMAKVSEFRVIWGVEQSEEEDG